MLLAGRVAVVTGGASGIGAASCLALASEGAALVVADINVSGADAIAKQIVAAGGRAISAATDVASEVEVAAVMDAAVEHFGRLDILFNNAADLSPELFARDRAIDELDIDVWERVLTVNLRGQMLCAKHALGHMVGGGGVVINMSSTASLVGDDVRAAYAAAKAGVNSLTRSIAVTHGKRGIRANAIAAGLVLTPPAFAQMPDWLRQVYLSNSLLPYVGTPQAIADVVVFLASDRSRLITGQVISVDGGALAHSPTMAQARAYKENHAD